MWCHQNINNYPIKSLLHVWNLTARTHIKHGDLVHPVQLAKQHVKSILQQLIHKNNIFSECNTRIQVDNILNRWKFSVLSASFELRTHFVNALKLINIIFAVE